MECVNFRNNDFWEVQKNSECKDSTTSGTWLLSWALKDGKFFQEGKPDKTIRALWQQDKVLNWKVGSLSVHWDLGKMGMDR